MLSAENGPILVHADSIIRKSLNSYFREHNPTDAGKWHFIKVRSRIQENTNKSLVMERMMAEKSKLSFMDNEWKWGIIPLTLFWNVLNLYIIAQILQNRLLSRNLNELISLILIISAYKSVKIQQWRFVATLYANQFFYCSFHWLKVKFIFFLFLI